jgi:ketosteroid isomerase-like protein
VSITLSPGEVVEALMQGISTGAWKELHTWFSDDAVVEYPFALPSPTRLEGKEAIKKYFAAVSAYPMKLTMRDMVVHETSDPEVVVAEWDYDGLVTTTGHAFRGRTSQLPGCATAKLWPPVTITTMLFSPASWGVCRLWWSYCRKAVPVEFTRLALSSGRTWRRRGGDARRRARCYRAPR